MHRKQKRQCKDNTKIPSFSKQSRKTFSLFCEMHRQICQTNTRSCPFFSQENVGFPRSDRVLVFLAYILSQIWVAGLFRNSEVIQPVWVCTSTSSGELQWGAMNATGCCDDNCVFYFIIIIIIICILRHSNARVHRLL
jgi:hypothetical protein